MRWKPYAAYRDSDTQRLERIPAHWQVTKHIEGPYGKFALLEVKIETGRTHQIRVHLSSIGHPVVGDTLYGTFCMLSRYNSGIQ